MPPAVSEATTYYISKGQKTVGPCSLDDLLGYIAYGSVLDSDLVRREGAAEWTSLRQLEELRPDSSRRTATRDITTRRRMARFRDYRNVPVNRRAGVVASRLVFGFLIFPPALWKAAMAIFQGRIYSSKTDEKGYLKPWPRWIEPFVTVMLALNSLLWLILLGWAWVSIAPLLREISSSLTEAMRGLLN